LAFNSASDFSSAAGSKVPPDEGERLLDLADDGLDLGFHRLGFSGLGRTEPAVRAR
jgi:hypothetical protein